MCVCICVEVASTRALYEKKLHRMMTQHSRHSVNNNDDAGKYSDGEDEEVEESGMNYYYYYYIESLSFLCLF